MHIIFKTGLHAAKKNIGPGLLLQGFALTLVLLYYLHEPTQQILLKVPEVQQRMGLFFPIGATALFGGFVPFIFLLLRKGIPRGRHLQHLLFMLSFWALMGLYVDSLYRFQSVLFGDELNAATIIKKVIADQFIFSVVFAAPFTTLAMRWKDHQFSFQATRRELNLKFITQDIPSVLIALWAVWIPTVAIIYSLPLALQFPLFNIVLCFWSLLLTAMDQPTARAISCTTSPAR